MDAVGISALLGRRHFGLTVRILAQINVVCQEGLVGPQVVTRAKLSVPHRVGLPSSFFTGFTIIQHEGHPVHWFPRGRIPHTSPAACRVWG
jgi:hypothetical protein